MSNRKFPVYCTMRVRVPMVPNFLRIADGPEPTPTIGIEKLTDAQLRDIGKEWTTRLVEHARSRRKSKK